MGIKNLSKFLKAKCPSAFVHHWPAIRAYLDSQPVNVDSIAVDANNHVFRFCKAILSTDKVKLAQCVHNWLATLCGRLGCKTVYLVCDATSVATDESKTSSKMWEWQRRKKSKVASRVSLENKKNRLRALYARRATIQDPRERLRSSLYWRRARAQCMTEWKREQRRKRGGVNHALKSPTEDDRGILALAVRLEHEEEQKLNSDIRVYTDRMNAVVSKDDIVQICRMVGSGATFGEVKVWECDGKGVTEAETMCAMLTRTGKAQIVVSEDSDVVPLNVSMTLRVMEGFPTLILMDRVYKALEFNAREIIDACVLSGCDMAPYIHRMGPMTAFKMIRKHKSLLMALRAMEAGNTLRPDPQMNKPPSHPHHTWPFDTEECEMCGKKSQEPEKLKREAVTPARSCDWCGALCCSRAMCWRNHLPKCFALKCIESMISAAKDFDDVRIFVKEYGKEERKENDTEDALQFSAILWSTDTADAVWESKKDVPTTVSHPSLDGGVEDDDDSSSDEDV